MTWVIVLLIGFGVGYWAGLRQAQAKAGTTAGDAAAVARRAQHEAAKAKALALFDTKPPSTGSTNSPQAGSGQVEIANDDVQSALGVSDATATNYLSELEAEGKIVQLGGQDGPAVRYRKA